MSEWYPATATMAAVDAAISYDQGATFRQWEGRVLPHIGDAYRAGQEPFRPHLGASVIGNDCARAVWYGFRWATRPRFDGRMLRLFNRGHLEEGRIIAALLTAGMEIIQQDENGKQFRIHGEHGHLGGSGDGMVLGCPDLPGGVVGGFEAKTSNEELFNEMVLSGVEYAQPKHFVQMQLYMHKFGQRYTLYIMVNKNTDAWHAEIVPYRREIAELHLYRAHRIIWMNSPPQRHTTFKCGFCSHAQVCARSAEPDVNCRTCKYSEPSNQGETGAWRCHLKRLVDIPLQTQYNGCESYARNTTF